MRSAPELRLHQSEKNQTFRDLININVTYTVDRLLKYVFAFISCVWLFCQHVCLYSRCMQCWQMPAKARRGCRTPLGLELKMLVSYQVGVGNRNQVLWTGNQRP